MSVSVLEKISILYLLVLYLWFVNIDGSPFCKVLFCKKQEWNVMEASGHIF